MDALRSGLILLMAAAWAVYPADYACLYADNGNTCRYEDTVLKPPLKLKWRAFTEGCFKSSPVVFKGRLFATDRQGQLYCLDAETGKLLWKKYHLTVAFSQNDVAPLAWGDYLYYFETGKTYDDQAGRLKCIRQDNGDSVWTYSPIGSHGGHPHFSPMFFQGNIYMTGRIGTTAYYFCFDALTGAKKWDKSFAYPSDAVSIAVQDIGLCTLGVKPFIIGSHVSGATDASGRLYGLTFAMTADSGRELWRDSAYSTPFSFSIYDTLLYLRSWDGPTINKMVAASVFTGDTVWTSGNNPAYPYAPAVDSQYVYTRGYGSSVGFYNRKTGVSIGDCSFSQIPIPPGGSVSSGCGNMILANGYGYCGFGHGKPGVTGYVPPGGTPRSGLSQGIYAYEIPRSPAVTQLKVVWYYKMASNMCTTPSVYEGKLYVTTNNEGAIYCFEND